jgi:hypothetical protein
MKGKEIDHLTAKYLACLGCRVFERAPYAFISPLLSYPLLSLVLLLLSSDSLLLSPSLLPISPPILLTSHRSSPLFSLLLSLLPPILLFLLFSSLLFAYPAPLSPPLLPFSSLSTFPPIYSFSPGPITIIIIKTNNPYPLNRLSLRLGGK